MNEAGGTNTVEAPPPSCIPRTAPPPPTPLPGGGAARLAICAERLVCRVLCKELVEADAVAVIFGACLAKSLNVEELFVLFK